MIKSPLVMIAACTTLFFNLSTRAAVPAVVTDSARKAQYEMIAHFYRGQFANDTQIALNTAVKVGALALEEQGYGAAAKELWLEWKTKYAHLNLRSPSEKVGDHAPLYAWLNTYYKYLEVTLGRRKCVMMHLNDIPIMNFVIPVAAQPGGDLRNGERWPKLEYQRHFVPFASISSYWITYGTCRARTPATYKGLCERVANVFKSGMREHVAPRLADFIYNTWGGAAKMSPPIDFTALDRYYISELAKISPGR